MPVSTRHPSYLAYSDTWFALRAAYAGSGAVKTAIDATSSTRGIKAAGTKFLPRPAGMRRQEQYDAYKGRAIWLGATERAVHGLTGAVFRREPVVTVPSRLEPHLNDITLTGVPFVSFAEQAIRETLLMGRAGLLVDFPAPTVAVDGSIGAPPFSSRPYWVLWGPEEIINWRVEQRSGDAVVTLVVLKESVPVPVPPFPAPDFFTETLLTQYRVLRLTEDGQYEVSLWRERDQGLLARAPEPVIELVAQWVPTRNGAPLPFIPFFFMAPFSLEPSIEKSLMEALVEVNYQHYRHSADYEHGLHLTGRPTPYITGYTSESASLEIGSATAWAIPSPDARVGMLEFQGQGLQSHERAMETDLKNMALLGARLLEQSPLVPETATAVRRRTDGSESPVQSLVKNVSSALTKAMRVHAWWGGFTESPQDESLMVHLNMDLVSASMEPMLLRELVSAWLSGGISFQTLYENLRKGEITRPGIGSDEEQALIEIEQEARGLTMPLATLPSRRPAGLNGERLPAMMGNGNG
jgi:hypothetical protein